MRAVLVLCAMLAAGCTRITSDFVCKTTADCVSQSGQTGRCEPIDRCSLPDTSCTSGSRYTSYAGEFSDLCTSIDDCVGDVRAGARNTCARRGDGEVWCWGDGSAIPARAPIPDGDIAQIDVAAAGLCARYAGGGVYCSAGVTTGNIAGLSSRQLAIGASHICAVTMDGHVACWGSNTRGELGDGTKTARTDPVTVNRITDVRQVAAGDRTSCAVTNAGEVWCWGDDSRGQLGRGVSLDEESDVPVHADGLPPADSVTVGSLFACAVTRDRQVWCWGDNDSGQLGQGTTGGEADSPERVPPLDGITDVSSGDGHTCALGAGGKLWCWGINDRRQCAAAPNDLTTPTLVVDGSGTSLLFHDVDAGAEHTCARAGDGTVYCWGRNLEGEVGAGTSDQTVVTPTRAMLDCR